VSHGLLQFHGCGVPALTTHLTGSSAGASLVLPGRDVGSDTIPARALERPPFRLVQLLVFSYLRRSRAHGSHRQR
jgi:hypothetical protein